MDGLAHFVSEDVRQVFTEFFECRRKCPESVINYSHSSGHILYPFPICAECLFYQVDARFNFVCELVERAFLSEFLFQFPDRILDSLERFRAFFQVFQLLVSKSNRLHCALFPLKKVVKVPGLVDQGFDLSDRFSRRIAEKTNPQVAFLKHGLGELA